MSRSSFGRVLHPVAGLAEHPRPTCRRRRRVLEGRAVVLLQFHTRAPQQRRPAEPGRHHPLPAELLVLLVGHLQEQQVGELFQVLAVGQPVVPQHVTEVPQLLHQGLRIRGHGWIRCRHGVSAGARPQPVSACRIASTAPTVRIACGAVRSVSGEETRRADGAGSSPQDADRCGRDPLAEGEAPGPGVQHGAGHEPVAQLFP